jgi:hypothetical protein
MEKEDVYWNILKLWLLDERTKLLTIFRYAVPALIQLHYKAINIAVLCTFVKYLNC